MWYSNCTPEEYGAWRRETVEEAAQLARYLNYNDLVGWGKSKELQATGDMIRPFDREVAEAQAARLLGRALMELLTPALARLRLRLLERL